MKVTAAPVADTAVNAGALGGTPAAAHARNVEVVETASDVSSATNRSIPATCPAGKLVIGGGASIDPTTPNQRVALRSSAPNAERTAWVATAVETDTPGAGYQLKAYAICANR